MRPFKPSCRFAAALVCAAVLAGCAGTNSRPAADYAAIVAAPDRRAADRETDRRRKPEPLLAFTGARPGMKVLDMGAGAGYSTELIARAVAPGGTVYAQNPTVQMERARERLDARTAPAMKSVVRVARNFDDPLPAGVRDLDLITFFFAYHDTAFMDVDRAKMNRRMYDALKPGGVLVVADHAAREGDGVSVVRTLHRIEEGALRRELEAAGFRLVDQADFLRNPQDPRDTIVFKSPVPVDEFVLKFEKPR